ncbi:DUF4255 domain-containing protein [Falsiroseomonas oryzae]|uniref:DUF4255 domain-containing protein n=1 Tax=Falsiroseomonas oryzae TaxID=2766473 RepID=UPI0022EACDE4|nr:DUF4255 domain-containing protein [Roseomonas sp. MO-31]
MSIAGATDSLVQLLRTRLAEDGGLGGFTVSAMMARDVRQNLQDRVGLLLYRVALDRTRRQVEMPRVAPAAPSRSAMGVELHYLLIVWGRNSAEGEQVMLGRCMAILDRFAVLSGPLLSPAYAWEPGIALQLSPDPLETEDFLRLWDGFEGPPLLSMPYLLRTVRLAPVERVEAPMVDSRTLIGVPAVPG